jgi:4-amino-4-deoxy-L-arabinose transferase-like glycosyltransferase
LSVRFASLLTLILICYCIFFYRLGDYPLWDPDEGRSGKIAKEMLRSGDWVTLTHEGKPYYDKPAPYFWLLAFGFRLSGLHEFPVRFPSALAAALTVVGVYLWASLSGGSERGFWAAMVLATSLEFVFLGRLARVDMVLTFFFTAALLSFLWWYQRGQGRIWIWLFYLFMALAVLAKGPVGLLLPLLIVAIAIGLRKRWALFREMDLLRGMVIVIVVAGPWYFLAAIRDPEYIWAFFWHHNIARYFTTEPGVKHPGPIYYFLPVLAVGYLPWSLFLPPVIYDFWKRRKQEDWKEVPFLLVWAAVVFVFFSFSRNKLPGYILPLFPPLALLMGGFLHQFHEARTVSKWIRLWLLAASLFWLLSILFLFPLTELVFIQRFSEFPSLNPPLLPVALFTVLLVADWILGQMKWTPRVVGLSSLWLVMWFYGVKASEISELKSSRSLARVVNEATAKRARVVAIRDESFSFYLSGQAEVVSGPNVVESRLQEGVPTVALVKEKHLRELKLKSPSRLFVWKSIPSANALVANFPPSPPPD